MNSGWPAGTTTPPMFNCSASRPTVETIRFPDHRDGEVGGCHDSAPQGALGLLGRSRPVPGNVQLDDGVDIPIRRGTDGRLYQKTIPAAAPLAR
jgi:hypothetical protein